MSFCLTPFSEKYKPQTISDFGFEKNMTELLETFLKMDRLALLFVGETGSGKTSLLNILIHTYYAPYLPSEYMNNIMFINNLKDQGFSFYRNEMKTFCQSRSLYTDRKKIVVLDDIDLINKQSQHVFRNYMDKYGTNVHFLLVCGNLQKVIESLQSRTYIMRISSASLDQRRRILERICGSEGLVIDDEAKEYVLKLSNNIAGNSVRNVVNFLEKIWLSVGLRGNGEKSVERITLEQCQQICSAVPLEKYQHYLMCLREGRLSSAVEIFLGIYDYGYSVIDILDYFFVFVKYSSDLTEKEKYCIIRILCEYISVYHNVHEHPIELALFTGEVYEMFCGNIFKFEFASDSELEKKSLFIV
jgi:DNA polymerase III delta prime subunit